MAISKIGKSCWLANLPRISQERRDRLEEIDSKYVESENSPNFSNFSLREVIPQYLNQCRTEGRNKGIRAILNWVKEQI